MDGVTLRNYPGCAAVEDLRLVTVPYRDFEGKGTNGTLVVREGLAKEVGEIFEDIYDTGFRINRIALPEDVTDLRSADPQVGVEIDDELMAANVTSAYNCRTLDGEVDKHGQGSAIDINPLNNPMVIPNPFITPDGPFEYSPPAAEGTWDVNPDENALLSKSTNPGAEVIRIFTDKGFRWGGGWKSLYDGQHFDKSE